MTECDRNRDHDWNDKGYCSRCEAVLDTALYRECPKCGVSWPEWGCKCNAPR